MAWPVGSLPTECETQVGRLPRLTPPRTWKTTFRRTNPEVTKRRRTEQRPVVARKTKSPRKRRAESTSVETWRRQSLRCCRCVRPSKIRRATMRRTRRGRRDRAGEMGRWRDAQPHGFRRQRRRPAGQCAVPLRAIDDWIKAQGELATRVRRRRLLAPQRGEVWRSFASPRRL